MINEHRAKRIKRENRLILEEVTRAPRHLATLQGRSPYENPDRQASRRGIEYLETHVESDGQYKSQIESRISGVLKNRYEIEPGHQIIDGKKVVTQRDAEIAEFVRWNLEHVPSFITDLKAMLSAISRGFSLSEINWKRITSGQYAGKIGIQNIRHKEQRYFSFAFDDMGYFQPTMVDPEYRRLPLNKFIHVISGIDDEKPFGTPLASPCSFYTWLKKGGFKDWSYFQTRFGQPLVKVGVPENTQTGDDADKAATRIFEAAERGTGIKVPKNLDVSFLEAMRSGTATQKDFVDACNREISVTVLGVTLTTDEGKNTGTHALGSVHAEKEATTILFDSIMLSSAINDQLIKRLVNFNFPGVENYPRFILPHFNYSYFVAFAQGIMAMVQAGVKIPMNWVRKIAMLPVPEEGEELVQQVIQTITNAQGKGIDNKAKEAHQHHIDNDRAIQDGFGSHFSAETEIENLNVKLIMDNDPIIRRYAGSVSVILEDEIRKLIPSIMVSGTIPEKSDKLNQSIATQINEMMVLGYLRGMYSIRKETEHLATFTEETQEEPAAHSLLFAPFNEIVQEYLNLIELNKAAYDLISETMKRKAFTVAGVFSEKGLNALHTAIGEGLEKGLTQVEIELKMSRELNRLGLSGLRSWHSELIVRNNLMEAYSGGREKVLSSLSDTEFPARQVLCILDVRTRPSHAAFHRFTRPLNDPIWNMLHTPFDHNCRCTIRAIHKSESYTITEVLPDMSGLGFVQ